MFLVFGGFTIAAGVLLAVTVVVLLAEARRKELATLRPSASPVPTREVLL